MKKRMSRALALLCSLALALSMLVPAFAAEPQEFVTVEVNGSEWIYQAGGLGYPQQTQSGPRRAAARAASTDQEIINKLVQEMENWATSIDVSKYNLTVEKASELVTKAINSSPQLFFIGEKREDGKWYPYGYSGSNGIVMQIAPIYNKKYNKDDVTKFNEAVAQALSCVSANMTNEQKALALHDYLATHIAYDTTYSNYDAYTALVEGSTVCQGYSLAYMLLLQRCGIPCEMVSSDTMNHAWNVIQLGNKWYHVDVTWDDPTKDTVGYARHLYFLRSNTGIAEKAADSENFHHDWTPTYTNADDDTKYESAFWKDSTAAVIFNGSKLYYIAPTYSSTAAGALLEREGNTVNAVYSFAENWSSGNKYWEGNFSGLSRSGNTLYWNDSKNVYQWKIGDAIPAENPTIVYEHKTEGEYIFGSHYLSDGKMNLAIGATPNSLEPKTVSLTTSSTDQVPVTSVSLNKKELALTEGGAETLAAAVLPDNATDKAVTWSSDKPEIATVENGKVTAKTAGTATITAKAGDKTATCTVTVTAKTVAVTGVTLNTNTLSLKAGANAELKATIVPADATNQEVTWSSDKPEIAAVANGKVTAVAAGEATVTVTTEDGKKTASCKVTVTADTTETTTAVESVTLDKSALELTAGDTTALTAAVKPENASNKNVTWSTSNEKIATVENGKVTAKAAGAATITVTTEDGGKTAACTVTVKAKEDTPDPKPVSVTGVTLDKSTLSLEVDDTADLKATVAPANAANKNVTWSTSDANVATVTNGKVTAKAAGETIITVTTADGNKTAACKVTVTAKAASGIPVTGVTLTKTLSMKKGDTITLKETVTPANATDPSVTWSSDKPEVATVDESGEVVAKAAGKATITVTTTDGKFTATCVVTVTEQSSTGGSTGTTTPGGGTGTNPPYFPPTQTTPSQPTPPATQPTYKPSTPATTENLAKDNWTAATTPGGAVGFKHTEPDGTPSQGVRYIETSDGAGVRYVFNNDGIVVSGQNTAAANSGITVTSEGEVLVNGNLYYLNPNRDEKDPRTCYVLMDYLRIRDNYAGQTYYDKDGITFQGWMKNAEGGLRYQTRIPQPGKQTDLYLIVWRVQTLPTCQHPDHPGDLAYNLPAGRYFFDDEGVLVQKEGWNDGKDGKEYYTNAQGMVIQERTKQ